MHRGLMAAVKNNTVATLSACACAVLVYAAAMMLLRGLKEEELLAFPKGYILVKIAKKLRLM